VTGGAAPATPETAGSAFRPGARGALAIALISALVAAIGFAMNAPLFALTLDDAGVPEATVGLLVTVAGVAAIACTPLVPWLMGRAPVKLILAGALAATAAMFGLYTVTEGALAWTAIRFGFAASLTLMFVTSEAWFLEMAPPHLRGRLLGLYAATFAGGFGIGGILLAVLGHQGPEAPLAGAVLALAVIPLLALIRAAPAARPEGEAASPLAPLQRLLLAPVLFVPAIAMGAIETAAFNLFPLWVRRVGFEDQAAGLLIAASALGNVLLQGPIGVIADRLGRNRTLLLVSIPAIAGPVAMAFATAPWHAYAAAFVWSGCVTGFYTLGLMGLAERFAGTELPGANAAFAASYGIGQMAAPVIGGALLQLAGPGGFMAGLAVMALAPATTLLLARAAARHPAPP
jgi:MFS family permease